jgi:hypothetical protein
MLTQKVFKVETPTVGAFDVLIKEITPTSINGKAITHIASTKIYGVSISTGDDSEGHAYVAILECVNRHFSSIN